MPEIGSIGMKRDPFNRHHIYKVVWDGSEYIFAGSPKGKQLIADREKRADEWRKQFKAGESTA